MDYFLNGTESKFTRIGQPTTNNTGKSKFKSNQTQECKERGGTCEGREQRRHRSGGGPRLFRWQRWKGD